jgi:hypothetical protein
VAYNIAGLHIVDVSHANAPALLGTYRAASGAAIGVALSGSTAYMAHGTAGLHIVDVSNASAPTLLGIYRGASGGAWAYGVALSGSTAYVAYWTSGLHIVDVRQGELRGVPVGDRGQKLSITVSTRNATAVLMNTTFTLTLDNLPYLLQTTVSDQRVFPDKVLSMDIDPDVFINPSQLPLIPSLQLTGGGTLPPWLAVTIFMVPLATYSAATGGAYGVALSGRGSTAYVAYWTSGLHIVDVSNANAPTLLGIYRAASGGGLLALPYRVAQLMWRIGLQGCILWM